MLIPLFSKLLCLINYYLRILLNYLDFQLDLVIDIIPFVYGLDEILTINYLLINLLLITLFLILIIIFRNKKPLKNFIKNIWSVAPLTLLNDNELISDSENDLNDSDNDNNDENKGWFSNISNFKNLTPQDQFTYIENKMQLRGLTINNFLIHYFIGTIIINTSGLKLDVDNFLNMNINTILNDQRNIQLNQHATIRFKPFLLNNSNESDFNNTLPFKSDDAFKFELQDKLNNMKEAHKLSEPEAIDNNINNN
jgi:hypothetical protein